jgi:hypothetical protein
MKITMKPSGGKDVAANPLHSSRRKALNEKAPKGDAFIIIYSLEALYYYYGGVL